VTEVERVWERLVEPHLAKPGNNASLKLGRIDPAEVAAIGGVSGVIAGEPDTGGATVRRLEAREALDERAALVASHHHLAEARPKPAPAYEGVAGLVGGLHAIAGHAVKAERPKVVEAMGGGDIRTYART
jgi:hypothetical protein